MIEFVVNSILPIAVSILFPALIMVLLFKKPKINNDQQLLCCSNSTNTSKKAKIVYESLEESDVKPDYQGALLNV